MLSGASPAQQVEDAVLLELAPLAEGFGAPLAHCAMRGAAAVDEFRGEAAVSALCRSGLRGTAAVDELRGAAAVSALWRSGLLSANSGRGGP